MNWLFRTLFFCALVSSVFACTTTPAGEPPAPPQPSSVVYIAIGEEGHCSGTYLGAGLVLTAAHCAGDSLVIKTDQGTSHHADVLWAHKEKDVMLLKVAFGAGLEPKASHLSCRKPVVGEPVTSSGNPYFEKFLTTHGYVAGTQRADGSVPLDIVIYPGMSGGPVFDAGGNIIGINDMVMTAPVNPIVGKIPLGIGYMVPSYVACELMGEGRA